MLAMIANRRLMAQWGGLVMRVEFDSMEVEQKDLSRTGRFEL